MVGETEYETTITANVEPAIGDSLREQMRSSVRSQVYDIIGGRIDFSQVQDPSQQTADSGQDGEDVAPVRAPRGKKKKAVEVVDEQPAVQEEAPPQPAPAPVRRKLEKPTFTF
jgi:hypothetical protein